MQDWRSVLCDVEVVVAGVGCRRCRAGYAYFVVCSGWSGRAYCPAECSIVRRAGNRRADRGSGFEQLDLDVCSGASCPGPRDQMRRSSGPAFTAIRRGDSYGSA